MTPSRDNTNYTHISKNYYPSGGDDTAAIQTILDSFLTATVPSGKLDLVNGEVYTISGTGLVIPPNVTMDCHNSRVTYTGATVAFTLGNSDTLLSHTPKLINLNLILGTKTSTGVRLRGTRGAVVTGNIEGYTAVIDNTRTNIGVDIDGVDISTFFNYISVNCNHVHEGFRVGTTGTQDATTQYFVNCTTLGDQASDDLSIGYNFDGSVNGGQGTVIQGGNVEVCNTAFLIGAGAGNVHVSGVRIEINITGTAWKFDFVNGCDAWTLIGVQGLGTTYMESSSGIRNFDSAAHSLHGIDGDFRINGFDTPMNAGNFIGLGGAAPAIAFDDGAASGFYYPGDTTGTGNMFIQPGIGSAAQGGFVRLYGANHATNAGECHVGSSSATGSFKVTKGLGGVTFLEVDTSTTAGDTRLMIWDVDNATLERVTVGIADSGGVGYKVLRILN